MLEWCGIRLWPESPWCLSPPYGILARKDGAAKQACITRLWVNASALRSPMHQMRLCNCIQVYLCGVRLMGHSLVDFGLSRIVEEKKEEQKERFMI